MSSEVPPRITESPPLNDNPTCGSRTHSTRITDRAADYIASPMTLPFQFRVGIPPKSLGKGSSVHWRRVRADYNALSWETAVMVHGKRMDCQQELRQFDALIMDILWMTYSSRYYPDPDNIVTRTSAIRDSLEEIGIVADDAHISIGTIAFETCKKGDECVVVTLREGVTDE